ncbi:aromatic amino acid aminotransferase [Limosilactobacillus reuteri]|jgi:Aspartate/tyrosine/aromatic aminotransferase|uniref:Aminotransferase n=3 Tax=Limosilactobacillus reuteri TaxID=1598 RepID=A0A1C1ZP68_LIMRT|nr:aminotransferase class I/II-fold pyridoxal phosphate-dependent enzyme [Limosilactobacillus reuteri]AGR63544.1 aspartate aminotransferase [Limosilactobacillus reuteri TD1]EDX43386.1 aminotransferase class I and II [Limosilactobacillus reuteri subsp. rodentium]MCC4475853.1 aminotransferase class I/II-fold pyridoxal phosphate-dependent enzyme [Limosilactobacillus reuteri]MCC4508507.1 aminotransferase class I/II-fold pyridoxal phosphate-dependent enzyme [Limosilactobacillus reuteri]MCH5378881.1
MPTTKKEILNRLNNNFAKLTPGGIREFDYQASAIPGIIKLTLGEPDFNVPAAMKQAAIDSINANDSHYAPGNGTLALRQAIAHFMQDRYELEYDPENEIAVTVGATEGIFASLSTIINPGDEIIIPTPTFPFYMAVTKILGGIPIEVDTSSDDFVLTPARLQSVLEEHPNAKGLVLNYPSNPTGVTYTQDQIKALADTVKSTNLIVIADEIYSELVYGATHTSIANYIPEQTLILNGASKSHAMTGYRIGFIAGPQELMKAVSAIHAMLVTAASNPAMAAAVAAFGTDEGKTATQEMKDAYEQRRDFVVNSLQKLGFELINPQGAFYVFAKIPKQYGNDDLKFATDLANEGKVAVIPGSFFGAGGQGYVRISYATSMENLTGALDNIASFINKEN